MKQILQFFLLFAVCSVSAQNNADSLQYSIKGKVTSANDAVPFANLAIVGSNDGTTADVIGIYELKNLKAGAYIIKAYALGYEETISTIKIDSLSKTLDFRLRKKEEMLDEVVVTGTRTPKRRTNSPVIVNLITSKTLDQVVATSLSEGLKYQPGLRVETDCQTCNYTQLRMNGLQGGYSQILINSRAVFSPLMGLYGMEQIPTNMIDRIEVVRGGVSALYGSSAIGGTVNVITKFPTKNNYNITNTYQYIDGQTSDNILTGNVSLVNEERNAGISLFVNNRNRDHYDANGDNFSELPQLKDNTFGANLFFLPSSNQKLEVSLSSIYEYRFGGENVPTAAYLAKQSEERMHNIIMGSADYSISFNDDKNSLSIYYGGQKTDRKHYTGIIPDGVEDQQTFFANPPYGISDVITHQGGFQFNNKFDNFLGGKAVLTSGAEYVYDAVFDEIKSYNYEIDQVTKNIGVFVQHDWDIVPSLNLLTGFRVDKHNLVDQAIVSPRLSLLYKFKNQTQFRLGWGTGFRAPQAFDTDLHIAFAGGGVSRIALAEGLKQEKSNSFTASVNYDRATEHFMAGFTLEGFYTNLRDAFFQFPLGEDQFGQIFEKRNGDGATVKGFTLETRANFDYVVQIEAGFTVQSSEFATAVVNIEGLPAKKEFLRTPDHYGYATLTYTPTKNWNISANAVYTGKMLLIHFAGDGTGQTTDEYFNATSFFDFGLRASRTFNLTKISTDMEIFGGVKNIFNAYQDNFDTGKNRDSNFVYGPSTPQTVFIGLRFKSM